MRKALICVFLFFFAFCIVSSAEAEEPVKIRVNGVIITPDVEPVVLDGRTLVPVRFVAEALGVAVNWDEKNNTVVMGTGNKPSSPPQDDTGGIGISVNGQLLSPDVPPVSVNGRVMVPIRFVAEALDCRVSWSERTNTVIITDKKLTTDYANILPASVVKQEAIDIVKEYAEKAYSIVSADLMTHNKFYDIYIYPDHNSFVDEQVEFRKVPRETADKSTIFYLQPNIIGIDLSEMGPDTGNKLAWSIVKLSGGDAGKEAKPEDYNVLPGNYQWQSFNTEYFQVYYYREEEYVKQVSQKFDDIYRLVVDEFGHKPAVKKTETGLVPVYFYTPEDFMKYLNSSAFFAGLWKNKSMHLNLHTKTNNDGNSIYRLFRHELTHGVTVGSTDTRAKNIPGWFREGIAKFHENDPPFTSNYSYHAALKKAVKDNSIMSWDALSKGAKKWEADHEQLGYAQSWSIWEFLTITYGEPNIIQIFYTDGDFKDIIASVTLKSLEELEKDWKIYIAEKYSK